MSSLYDIEQRYLAALDAATDPENDFAPMEVFKDTLDGIEGEAEDKIHNVIRYARNLESEADAIKQAMASMKIRLDAKRRRAEHLREYAMEGMQVIGKKKLEWPDFVASVAPSPESVVVDDEESVPDDYCRYTRALDKKLIASALREGYEIPGCRIEKNWHLRIR